MHAHACARSAPQVARVRLRALFPLDLCCRGSQQAGLADDISGERSLLPFSRCPILNPCRICRFLPLSLSFAPVPLIVELQTLDESERPNIDRDS